MPSQTTSEVLDGVLVDSIHTADDADAHEMLMRRTGWFLNALEHCARFHPGVVTGDFLFEVLDDLDYLQLKYALPTPTPNFGEPSQC